MTPHELLIAARAKIEKPENWCQGAMWCSADGHPNCRRVEATQFCALGALFVVGIHNDTVLSAKDALQAQAPDTPIVRFNDTRDHSDVLMLFDRAIEATAS